MSRTGIALVGYGPILAITVLILVNNLCLADNASEDITTKLESSSPSQLALPQNGDAEIRVEESNLRNDGVPPGFEKVLPEEMLQKLRHLHANLNMTFHEKKREFDKIMSSVSKSLLVKLPLPPGFETLPADVQEKVRAVHGNASLDWGEKHKAIGKIFDELPLEQRIHLRPRPVSLLRGSRPTNFPPSPPPGFERVLPNDTYAQLLSIHQDPSLAPKEKIHRIDEIMRNLTQDILDQLPLPPGFEQLPEDKISKARTIFSNKSLGLEEKTKSIIRFIKQELTSGERRLVRPPLPPSLEQLPQEIKDKFNEIFENEDLDEDARHAEFWKLVETLPEPVQLGIKAEVGDEPPQ